MYVRGSSGSGTSASTALYISVKLFIPFLTEITVLKGSTVDHKNSSVAAWIESTCKENNQCAIRKTDVFQSINNYLSPTACPLLPIMQ